MTPAPGTFHDEAAMDEHRVLLLHPQRFTEAVEAFCVAARTLYDERGLLIMHRFGPDRAAAMLRDAIAATFSEPVTIPLPDRFFTREEQILEEGVSDELRRVLQAAMDGSADG